MFPRYDDAEIQAVTEIIRRGQLSSFYCNWLGGRTVQAFEEAFAAYTKSEYAISVSNGTAALHTALLAAGLKNGLQVITTPYTFVATASAVLMTGATPVFCDVDGYGNLDPESAARMITKDTAAILAVHLVGRPAKIHSLKALAEKHDLTLIEDCAQALGARVNGKHVGNYGIAGTFSFQETKTISTGGEGGMIITSDPQLARKCWEIRNHGEKYAPNPLFWGVGYNYRMTEIQAAFGIAQLQKLDGFMKIQKENAEAVLANLPKGIYGKPRPAKGIEPTYFIIDTVYSEDTAKLPRDTLIEKLTELGINKGVPGQTIGKGYDKPLYQLPYIRDNHIRSDTSILNQTIATSLWLDIHRWRSKEETLTILDQIKGVIENAAVCT